MAGLKPLPSESKAVAAQLKLSPFKAKVEARRGRPPYTDKCRPKLNPNQQKIVEALRANGGRRSVAGVAQLDVPKTTLATLVKRGDRGDCGRGGGVAAFGDEAAQAGIHVHGGTEGGAEAYCDGSGDEAVLGVACCME